MGEAKRRKASGGGSYKSTDNERIWPGVPITKRQANQAYELTTRGAWVGIGLLVVFWVVVRFVGPALGLWTLLTLS